MKIERWYESYLHAAAAVTVAVMISWSGSVFADQPAFTVTVDENGNGTANTLTLSLRTDVNCGTPCLVYDLTPIGAGGSMTDGFLFLLEPGCTELVVSCLSDLIFFTSPIIDDTKVPLLVFLSDSSDGVSTPADFDLSGLFLPSLAGLLGCGQPGLTVLDLPACSIAEVGSEGDNGATYIPTNATGRNAFEDPGFFNGRTLTYQIISDAPTTAPEPATLALLGLGLAALGLSRRRKLSA